MRRRSSWHLASIAGLILALGSGCKNSSGGNGDDDPDSSTPDGGEGNNGEGGSPEAGNGNPDTSVPDTSVPDTGPGNGDPDGGDNDPDGGNPGDGGDGGPVVPEGIADKTSVDFGLSNCGGDAPASQTFKLTNTGAAAVTYTVTLSNSNAFSIEGATGGTKSGSVAPGTDVSITLNASAVPTSATAGVAIGATATVTTNLPAPNNSFVIPLKVTPRGAHLALDPVGGADWILVQTGEGATFTPVTLQNSGNAPAELTVTQPVNDAFDLYTGTSTTELAAGLTVPAAANNQPGTQAFNASFNPLTNGAYTSRAALAVTGAVCNGGTAASVTEIPFEGAASNNGLSVQRTPLANRVNCGTATPPASTVTLRNYTQASMTVAVSTLKPTADSPFTLSQTALSLAPGASSTFDIAVKAAVVPQTATPGTILSDSILIDPSDPAVSQRIFGLTTTIQGAHLTYGHPDNNGVPTGPFADGAFNGANNQTTTAKSVTILNTGNYPAAPVFTLVSTGDTYTQTGALTPAEVPIGTTNTPGSAAIAVTFRPPVNDATRRTATLQIGPGPNDVICGALPPSVTLSGTPSTPGYQLLSGDPIQFGNAGAVACPTPGLARTPGAPFRAADKTVTIQNTGNTPLEWTATVDTAAFSLSVAAGTIPAPTDQMPIQTGSFDVIPANIPFPPASLDPATYSGNLTIKTNIPNDTDHVIPLQQYPQGAVLTVTAGDVAFGEVNVNFESDAKNVYTVANDGNIDATLSTSGSQSRTTGGPRYHVDARDVQGTTPTTWTASITRGTPALVSGYFDPIAGNSYTNGDLGASSATLVFTSTTPLCSELPADVVLTGTATDEVSFNVPDDLYFAASAAPQSGEPAGTPHVCGAPRAQDPKTVFITNYGTEPLIIDSIALNSTQWFTAYLGSQGTTSGQVPAATVDSQTGTYSPGVAVAVVVPKTVPSSANPADSTLDAELTITAHFAGTTSIIKSTNIRQFIDCTQP
ncbi:MAG: hypothetical protein ABW352_01025 [Polyangiales bacterium]